MLLYSTFRPSRTPVGHHTVISDRPYLCLATSVIQPCHASRFSKRCGTRHASHVVSCRSESSADAQRRSCFVWLANHSDGMGVTVP